MGPMVELHGSLPIFCAQEALHAKMAETLKQTEMAARVSSWQQKIERNLEEQVNSNLLFPSKQPYFKII